MNSVNFRPESSKYFEKIKSEFGESAYTLAFSLLTAFADAQLNTPDRSLIDRQIATSLAMLVENEILTLDTSQIFPTFTYSHKDASTRLLFRVVKREVQSDPHCFEYSLTREDKEIPPILLPDPLVGLINRIASLSHKKFRNVTTTDMPIIEGDVSESDYWAEEDLMLHLMAATVNTLHIILGEDIE